MEKHTPGPWVISMKKTVLAYELRASKMPHMNGKKVDSAQHEANARLIAAAPELLAALEHARTYLRRPKFDPGMRDAVAVVLEAAIAKAEGKQ